MTSSTTKTVYSALAALLVGASALTWVSPANAEGSAYCRKVRARAAGDAALLFAPSVQAQGIRFPESGIADVGPTAGSGFQVRANVQWSPLDFYKGFRVLNAGDADCARADATVNAQDVIMHAEDSLRLHALKAQATFLDERRPALEKALGEIDALLDAHRITLAEAIEMRARATAIVRKSAEVRGSIAQLDAQGIGAFRDQIAAVMNTSSVHAKNMKYETEISHLRALDAWDVRMTGTVIPMAKVEYAGFVQVGLNFGTFWRNSNEQRYVDARSEELSHARYELENQVKRFRDELRALAAQLRQERTIVESQQGALANARKSMAEANATAPQSFILIDLDDIQAESDRVFITTLLAELSRIEETIHGQ